MGEPKRHHQISQFILRRFAAPPEFERIWTHDKDQGSARETAVDATAFETHLYSVVGEGGERNTEVEKAIGRIESDGAPAYEKLIAGVELTPQERMYLASLIAITYVRTNAFRRLYAESLGRGMQATQYIIASSDKMWEATMRNYERDRGPLAGGEKEMLREAMLDPSGFMLAISKEATLRAIAFHDKMTPIINAMRWTMMVAPPGRQFIISDNPVAKETPKKYWHPIYGDGGLVHDKVEVTFPLTPELLLIAHWDENFSREYKATPEMVKALNRTRAFYAGRFLYGPSFDAGLVSLATKFKGSGLTANVSGAGPEKFADVVMKRKL
jgi:hypothetical protein